MRWSVAVAAQCKSGRTKAPISWGTNAGRAALVQHVTWIGPSHEIAGRGARHGTADSGPARAARRKPSVPHGVRGMFRPGRFHVREINKTERIDPVNIVRVAHGCRVRLSCRCSVI